MLDIIKNTDKKYIIGVDEVGLMKLAINNLIYFYD